MRKRAGKRVQKRAKGRTRADALAPAGEREVAARIDELMRAAAAASKRAHSPYSGVVVGAALLARDGQVFTGCNVENASYGLTLCAERVAIVKAVSAGVREFDALAITTNRARTLMPCGACRQVLQEFAPELTIVCQGVRGRRRSTRLAELLPDAFGPRDLD